MATASSAASSASPGATAAAAAAASVVLTPPSKRLAKRSILGTRVAVRGDDGKFYAGMIQATKTCEEAESSSSSHAESNRGGGPVQTENRYSVRLDATRKVKECAESEIIGPGFGSVAGNKLCAGQIVYVTHMNREVQGAVLHHGKESVVIQLLVSANNHTKHHETLQTVFQSLTSMGKRQHNILISPIERQEVPRTRFSLCYVTPRKRELEKPSCRLAAHEFESAFFSRQFVAHSFDILGDFSQLRFVELSSYAN